MAYPTITKTWQFINNVAITNPGNCGDQARRVFWNIKNILTTFPTNPWKCVASSNAVTCLRYGVDSLGPPGPAYDTWGATYDASKLHQRQSNGYSSYDFATSSKHSWIILRNTALDTTYDLCIDLWCNFNDTQGWNGDIRSMRFYKMYICRSYNLTGSGSITSRPSPNTNYVEPDLRNGDNNSYGGLGGNIAWQSNYRIHAMMSDDGLHTRLLLCSDGRVVGLYMFERIAGMGSGGTSYPNPVVAVGRGEIDHYGVCTYGWLHDNSTQMYDAANGTAWPSFSFTSEGLGSNGLGEYNYAINEQTNKLAIVPVGVGCWGGGYRGKIGYLPDLWWSSTDSSTPSTYPNDGSRQYMQADHLVFPWNGDYPYST